MTKRDKPIPRSPDKKPDGFRLGLEIVSLSVANNWDNAKLEWSLDTVFLSSEPGHCLCGHAPIVEHCVLVNRENGNRAVVGNFCVKRFLGLSTDELFQALGRIAKDNGRSLNVAAIEFAFDKEWINDWERTFCLNTMRKRRLSNKQREKRRQINDTILFYATEVTPVM